MRLLCPGAPAEDGVFVVQFPGLCLAAPEKDGFPAEVSLAGKQGQGRVRRGGLLQRPARRSRG